MYLGVDAGSAYIKLALLGDDGRILAKDKTENIADEVSKIDEKIARFLDESGGKASDVRVSACGYGSQSIKNPDARITEITALAKGLSHVNQEIDCIIDIGGQDFKVIHVAHPQGTVKRFYMNDKCSSGTGAFVDAILRRLSIPFNEFDEHYFSGDDIVELSSVCTVFASTEIISHIFDGRSVDSLLRGTMHMLAGKIAPYVNGLGQIRSFTLAGGLSSLKGLSDAFEKEIDVEYVPVGHPEHLGAIGAAKHIMDKGIGGGRQ